MSVGPLTSHTSVIRGHLTVTLVDGEGNIKEIRQTNNLINVFAKKILASCAHNAGAGVSALYIFLWSGMNGTPTQSMGVAHSGYGNASLGMTGDPLTAVYNWVNDAYWSLSGTMSFVGAGPWTSINAAALAWQPTNSLSWDDRSCSQWWALACFTDLAITSVDKLSFNWVFCLSTTTSTAV